MGWPVSCGPSAPRLLRIQATVTEIRVTTLNDLPGPDGDDPYKLFVNQRFQRTRVLSAQPDLKDEVMVCMETLQYYSSRHFALSMA